ncbi:MAG TPA: PQQ-dependent dehydrogenase, methanol/ethanol family [Piscinibacter sp.]|uniref:PQQ-dependent dehydrogenase, methanol/ethanol family n=1 Tax=Piscinibacter sp. TaxID=1903157 RepID=UPI001D4D1888|nr:PQQ-dependent dehydrogenase, methanol/ethanol family [Piscinibacter sp.]MBK7531824.1 PQQ-dependent dehydrogenase, methanol/ethanol family [Piscinibacter sp.]MBL0092039.1 PQQ-dependent dehydrogenase, methanol/ethanol family [Piscinibacter sp.]HPG77705.1 PQQ-dependent dehydrogenase, methanol/ethanol family [Piscinibacter sp.]HPM68286.1 PQQ-dependent dehydrogenase, methanol/ethanol family [Piscinibacter sp.]
MDLKFARGLAAMALSLAAAAASAQSTADLRNDAATPGDVTTYGMGWSLQRHTPLKRITPANVKHLAPVWNLSLDNSTNASNQPLVIDGVMYVASHTHTIAIDALTGRQKWKVAIELPNDIAGYLCCGIHTRGMAALNGVLYRTTIDAHVMAISMADGKVLWKQKAAEYKDGYSMTHAPLIADGVLITGISGGEYGSRGFLDGWDLKTGEKKWHRWTTAAPGEPGGDTWKGEAYKTGGAPTWLTGSYDPELNLVYWGVGNGGPWNAAARGGDSLYIGSVLALKPATGEIVWHYQFSPGDPYDYDGTNELVLADLPNLPNANGKTTKVLMQANRNGFFYVIDRSNGKLISGTQFARKVNWASGIDKASGRPIDTPMTAMVKKTEETPDFIEVWPSAFGGKNWMPMSYDPGRKLVFLNSIDLGMKVKYVKQDRPGGPNWYLGLELGGFVDPSDGNRGALVAWDPVAAKPVWTVRNKSPFWAGVLSTASGVVFTGSQTGQFIAFDSKTGKKLWSFQTGSGISGLPIAWEKNGREYITVLSGAAQVYGALAGDPDLANVPAGGSVWTFALPPGK